MATQPRLRTPLPMVTMRMETLQPKRGIMTASLDMAVEAEAGAAPPLSPRLRRVRPESSFRLERRAATMMAWIASLRLSSLTIKSTTFTSILG